MYDFADLPYPKYDELLHVMAYAIC